MPKMKGRFSITTDSVKWSITYFHDNQSITEAVYDGNYTYAVARNLPLAAPFKDPKVLSCFTNIQQLSEIDAAIISTLNQPTALVGSAQVAWMGLVACNIISNTSPAMRPPWPHTENEAMSYQLRRIKPEDATGCCMQYEFITSEKPHSNILTNSTNDIRLAQERESHPNKYFTEGRLRVLSWTNLFGKCIPLETEFTRYRLSENLGGTNGNIRDVIISKVEKCYLSSQEIALPKLTKTTHVADTRFHVAGMSNFAIYYSSTNGEWLSEQDPRLPMIIQSNKDNYFRIKELLEKKDERPVFVKWYVFVLISMVLMGPFAIYIIQKSSTKRKNVKT